MPACIQGTRKQIMLRSPRPGKWQDLEKGSMADVFRAAAGEGGKDRAQILCQVQPGGTRGF